MRALGLVNPTMRDLAEMAYEFEEPFVLDTSKYEATFGGAGTPVAPAIATTIDWYRSAATTPPQQGPTSRLAPETTLPPGKVPLSASAVRTGPVARSESSPALLPATGFGARPSRETATPSDSSA